MGGSGGSCTLAQTHGSCTGHLRGREIERERTEVSWEMPIDAAAEGSRDIIKGNKAQQAQRTPDSHPPTPVNDGHANVAQDALSDLILVKHERLRKRRTITRGV